MLFVAGHEPTANLISSSLLILLRHTDLASALCAEPTVVFNAAEELILWHTATNKGREGKGSPVALILARAAATPRCAT